METTQNEILDKMSSPDNADNLVELQLNLARGMEEIKLEANNFGIQVKVMIGLKRTFPDSQVAKQG